LIGTLDQISLHLVLMRYDDQEQEHNTYIIKCSTERD